MGAWPVFLALGMAFLPAEWVGTGGARSLCRSYEMGPVSALKMEISHVNIYPQAGAEKPTEGGKGWGGCCCAMPQGIEALQGSHITSFFKPLWLSVLFEPESRLRPCAGCGGACSLPVLFFNCSLLPSLRKGSGSQGRGAPRSHDPVAVVRTKHGALCPPPSPSCPRAPRRACGISARPLHPCQAAELIFCLKQVPCVA